MLDTQSFVDFNEINSISKTHSLMIKCLTLFSLFLLSFISSASIPTADIDSSHWQKTNYRNYELDIPGAGVSQSYKSSLGWITVYQYSGEINNWQEGTIDSRFQSVFDEATNGILAKQSDGTYTEMSVSDAENILIAGIPYKRLNLSYISDNDLIISSLYLTIKDGKILKYRISFYGDQKIDANETAIEFIAKTQDFDITSPEPKNITEEPI